MNLRHAAALALVGWYLLVPGLDPHTGELDTQAPLSAWAKEGSYDTVAECTQARQAKIDWSHRVEAEWKAATPQARQDFENSMDRGLAEYGVVKGYYAAHPHLPAEMTTAMRCIASDDPRLAK